MNIHFETFRTPSLLNICGRSGAKVCSLFCTTLFISIHFHYFIFDSVLFSQRRINANLVELEKCCQTHIFLQNFVLIQPRTSPLKICEISKIFVNFVYFVYFAGLWVRSSCGGGCLVLQFTLDRKVGCRAGRSLDKAKESISELCLVRIGNVRSLLQRRSGGPRYGFGDLPRLMECNSFFFCV